MTGTILHHCRTCGAYAGPEGVGHDEEACAQRAHDETYRRGRAEAQAQFDAARAKAEEGHDDD